MEKKFENDAKDIFDDGSPYLSHSSAASVGINHVLNQRITEIKEKYRSDDREQSEKTKGVNESATS